MDIEQSHAVEAICDAIKRISYGGVDSPTGLEGLAMAIAGEGPFGASGGLAAAITSGFGQLAEAIENASTDFRITITHATKES